MDSRTRRPPGHLRKVRERGEGGENEGFLFRDRKKEMVSLEMDSTVIRGSYVYGGRGALNTLDKSRPLRVYTFFSPPPWINESLVMVGSI